MAVPNPRVCSSPVSIYQKGLELHARVAVDFWEDDWSVPHLHCQEDPIVPALLPEPEPPEPQALQPGRASVTRSLPPSSTNAHHANEKGEKQHGEAT